MNKIENMMNKWNMNQMVALWMHSDPYLQEDYIIYDQRSSACQESGLEGNSTS